jgi:hypothetical protein
VVHYHHRASPNGLVDKTKDLIRAWRERLLHYDVVARLERCKRQLVSERTGVAVAIASKLFSGSS